MPHLFPPDHHLLHSLPSSKVLWSSPLCKPFTSRVQSFPPTPWGLSTASLLAASYLGDFFLPSVFKTCEIIKAVPVTLARGRWRQGVAIKPGQSYIVTYTAAEARVWDAVLTWETERCHQLFQRWSSEVKLTCLCKPRHLKVRIQASLFSFPIFLIPDTSKRD